MVSKKTLWKVACQEDKYPGMWQRWFKNQCVAVGWPPGWGRKLDGSGENSKAWVAARNALEEMAMGDRVIASLRGHRIGRMGEIVGKQIADKDWDPLVPVGPKLPYGEMGRRILVRWQLTIGPDDRDLVIQMPSEHTLTIGELRPAVSRIRSHTIDQMRSIMDDPKNWVGLLGKFGYEKALSDYIATYPQHLEDGLLPHPNARIREMVFTDRKRMDVLLIDRERTPVIVECKQHSPYVWDIKQLRHYMKRFHEEDQAGRPRHSCPWRSKNSIARSNARGTGISSGKDRFLPATCGLSLLSASSRSSSLRKSLLLTLTRCFHRSFTFYVVFPISLLPLSEPRRSSNLNMIARTAAFLFALMPSSASQCAPSRYRTGELPQILAQSINVKVSPWTNLVRRTRLTLWGPPSGMAF